VDDPRAVSAVFGSSLVLKMVRWAYCRTAERCKDGSIGSDLGSVDPTGS
jgi:hypothetical protein